MISPEEREIIKEVLGHNYSALVSDELENRGMRNRNGHPHSWSMINNVMNGQGHSEIEKVIFDLVEKKQLKNEKDKARREAIIKRQEKTEAVTSVH